MGKIFNNTSKFFGKTPEKSARLILDKVLDRQNTTPSHACVGLLDWSVAMLADCSLQPPILYLSLKSSGRRSTNNFNDFVSL